LIWEIQVKRLEASTETQLANELVEFSTKEFGEIRSPLGFSTAHFDDYWKAQGIDKYDLSVNLRNKITRVHTKAIGLLTKSQRENQLSKLDDYIDICVKWAKQNDFVFVDKAPEENPPQILIQQGRNTTTSLIR